MSNIATNILSMSYRQSTPGGRTPRRHNKTPTPSDKGRNSGRSGRKPKGGGSSGGGTGGGSGISSQPPESDGATGKRSLLSRLALLGLRFTALAIIWGSLILLLVGLWYASDLPDINSVAAPERQPSITILANNGQLLAHVGETGGRYIPRSQIPRHMIDAVLSIEDKRFYKHFGIDIIGLVRASYHNMRVGRVVQGGSTITQQLAKNLFLSPARTFRRKVQELMLALWLEHNYTKDQILTAYLNRVYLGSGAWGIDAAAKTYFNVSATNLTVSQAALLAGLLRAPSRFSPNNDINAARDRARVVIQAMQDNDVLTPAQAVEARNSLNNALAVVQSQPPAEATHFVNWIAAQARDIMASEPQDVIIETTLDIDLQQVAEAQVSRSLKEGAAKNVQEAALLTLAPDGAIRAMVGGSPLKDSDFNRATSARRQPGSAFKPIVYLAALRKGYTPDSMIEDAPLRIGRWSPENYDGEYRGEVTLRTALAHSLNTAAVRLLRDIGTDEAQSTARALGLTSPLTGDLSLALGTSVVTMLDLAGAYASIANGGRVITPWAIRAIKSRDGKMIYRRRLGVNPPNRIPLQAVQDLVSMMQDVVREGTGAKAALGDRPVAGKTGTSSDWRDAWFMGFTADYITGVWMGNDDNAPMKNVTGATLPAKLWHDYMNIIHQGLPVRALLSGMEDNRNGVITSSDSRSDNPTASDAAVSVAADSADAPDSDDQVDSTDDMVDNNGLTDNKSPRHSGQKDHSSSKQEGAEGDAIGNIIKSLKP